MNVERLLREVEQRLQGRDEALRESVLDAVREAIGRERRWAGTPLPIEAERERRVEAEAMREVLEAIDRPASTEEALDEAARHAARVLDVDVVAIAQSEAESGYRIVAAHGGKGEPLLGQLLRSPQLEAIASSRQPTVVDDAEAEPDAGCPLGLPLRSWAVLPMLYEGQSIGLLVLGRHTAPGFTEDGMHRGRRIAFAVAAVLARHRQLEQVRRYALLLELVLDVHQSAFTGAPRDTLLQQALEGACRVSGSRGGLLVVPTAHGQGVGAVWGDGFEVALGRPSPADLASPGFRRLSAERMLDVADELGINLPAGQACLVPLKTPDQYVGCLTLLDSPCVSPNDMLLQAYASRVAVALRYVASPPAARA